MKEIVAHFKQFYHDCKSQDFAFYMVAAYLVFSYLRPQVIYPWLNFLPWTQITILSGLVFLLLKQRLSLNAASFICLLFALIASASSLTSQYPEISFAKLDIPFIWFVEVLFFTNAVKNLKQFKLLIILLFLLLAKMSFFGARIWALRGFGFASWGISGPPGFFQNSGEFSLLMAILTVVSLGLLLAHENVNRWYYLLPLTAFMTVLGASSRGGQLAVLVGLMWINIFIVKIKFKNIIVVALVGYLGFILLPDKQKERFTNMGEDGTSTSRLTYWAAGIEMINDYPVLGVGYYGFPEYFSEHYSYLKEGGGYSMSRKEVSHNSLVQVGSTMGYTGLIVYVYMHLLCLRQSRIARRQCSKFKEVISIQWIQRFSIGFDAGVLTFFVGAFFMSVALYPYIFLLLMISQALKKTLENEIKTIKKTELTP